MAELKSDTARTDQEGAREERARSRSLGRRIATVVVLFGLVYIVAVGLVSVIPQAFWPDAAELEPAIACGTGVHDLQAELLAHAGAHVARGGSDNPSAHARYLESWDLRHRGLEARCRGDERDAWERLGRVRERLQATLARFDAEEGALARQVDYTLARHGR